MCGSCEHLTVSKSNVYPRLFSLWLFLFFRNMHACPWCLLSAIFNMLTWLKVTTKPKQAGKEDNPSRTVRRHRLQFCNPAAVRTKVIRLLWRRIGSLCHNVHNLCEGGKSTAVQVTPPPCPLRLCLENQ